jgi:hypothetical protein
MAALINAPPETPVDRLDDDGSMLAVNPSWRNWFGAVFLICNAMVQSGTTAQRPVKLLWVGRFFMDVTIGKPIWIASLTPTVWVTADGIPA